MPTLDWIGEQAVVNHHREVPYRPVHCDSKLSVGDPDVQLTSGAGRQSGGFARAPTLLCGQREMHLYRPAL